MRYVYKKKYSKAEERVKMAETGQGTKEMADAGSHIRKQEAAPCEQRLRELLMQYGRKLVETGLVQGTWGNLSVRLDERYMLVTPSGLDYMRLGAEDMVKVDIRSLEYEGDIKPTSEKGLHAAIYKKRPDVGAVIHTHSKYCSVFAAAGKDMPVLKAYSSVFGDKVKTASYALPGSKSLMNNTAEAVGNNYGAIMSNHGMVACGRDLEAAFENCVNLEENGKRYLSDIV